MGSSSEYSSPKTSYESSSYVVDTPKYSSYESSKVSSGNTDSTTNITSHAIHSVVERNSSSKNDLNSFRDLITRYLEVEERIEQATSDLNDLQQQKTTLEEQISSNPEFEKFATMFTSISDLKGPKR